jgi:hypothetical protein
MPGGKGKIRPEDGKQFSSEYQPQEKWTEKRALELGNELISWLRKKEKGQMPNIFIEEYLYLEKDLYPGLISYLCEKFTSFSNLIEKAKKIQEVHLAKWGTFDKLNSAMTKFVLINNHGWKDKTETELTGKDGKDLNAPMFVFQDASGKVIEK